MAVVGDPTYPVAGDEVTLSITNATGSTDATRWELVSVPDRSALEVGALVDAGGDPIATFTPDAAGVYAVRALDYRRYSGIGAYAGDPAGEAVDRLVATQTGDLYVADVVELPIAGAGHSVTLSLKVLGGTVVAAELVRPTTAKARLAALDTGVLAAVAALEGEDAGTFGGNLITEVTDFIAKFNAHLETVEISGPINVHVTQDFINPFEPIEITTQEGALAALPLLASKMYGHLGTNADGWHVNIDGSNVPIVPSSVILPGGTVMFADLRRTYGRHLAAEPNVHPNEDEDNVLAAASLLSTALMLILDFFAAQVPSTPTGENPALVRTTSKHGFRLAS